jgi:D-alanyl-lipoteichoic acid acyltransferase DltB (MBOAT superfamily)
LAFNSTDYLLFLVVAFALFWPLARLRGVRVLFLLALSYLFYTAWNGALVGLIILSSVVDYACGGLIHRLGHRTRTRKLLLATSVLLNLGLLGFFKYANFFIDNASAALGAFGVAVDVVPLDVILPVGISFYTFQSLSYTIDIYRGALEPARSIKEFFLFVAFFPQLVAGPIVRARELLPQFDAPPRLDRQQLADAFYRLLRGLVKKMIIADYLAATIVDPLFQAPESASGLQTFLALVAFHFQVYCDFSGYTDIAIGSAGLFGFRLPENFATPYAAHTPSSYWQRWHMTLSRFCFDYIYKPLGGSKRGTLRTYFNTLVTFSVIGLWHGANWNYVLFGVYHALGVIGTRMLTAVVARIQKRERRAVEQELAGRLIPILATNLFIIGSLPLFRSPDMATALFVYNKLLTLELAVPVVSSAAMAVLAVAMVSHFVPVAVEERLRAGLATANPVLQTALVFVLGVVVLQMASVAQQSFVYFQF